MTFRAYVPLAIAAILVAGPVLAQSAPTATPVVTEPAAPTTPATTKAGGKSGCGSDRHAMS